MALRIPIKKLFRRKAIPIWVILLALLMTAISLWTRYDDLHPIQIHLILPDDFKGLATIQFTERDGDSVEFHNRVVTYYIPSSGILKLRDENPAFRWHIIIPRRASGQQLPIGDQNDELNLPAPGVVAVWPLALEGDDSGFFVGTIDEIKEWNTHQDWYIAMHGTPTASTSRTRITK